MAQPIHLSTTGIGGGSSADPVVANRLAAEDAETNRRSTLCGAPCGSHAHLDEEEVVKVTDTHRRDALVAGGEDHDRLCQPCLAEARSAGMFDWITRGAPLIMDDPEARRILRDAASTKPGWDEIGQEITYQDRVYVIKHKDKSHTFTIVPVTAARPDDLPVNLPIGVFYAWCRPPDRTP
jgi:hypothetical protein